MKQIASIKIKRICKTVNCTCILSIYNMEKYCYKHRKDAENKKALNEK